MEKTKRVRKAGVYNTIYGNTCHYEPEEYFDDFGEEGAYDMDMAENIPLGMVDWDSFIREEY